MRYFANILLLFIYISFTVGFTTSITYCGGNVETIELGYNFDSDSQSEDCCRCLSCEATCCVSEVETIKIVDAYNFFPVDIKFNSEVLVKLNENSIKDITSGKYSIIANTIDTSDSRENNLYLITASLLI